MNVLYHPSPLGKLRLVSNGQALTHIEFEGRYTRDEQVLEQERCDDILDRCRRQLQAYFSGEHQPFDMPLAPSGTDFQLQVWRALQAIPYGTVCSYADIARRIDRARAIRAVGAANGRNPLPIVVPCHRVIGSDGSLTGFAGGLEAKTLLLQLEGALPQA